MIIYRFNFRSNTQRSALILCIRKGRERVRLSTGIIDNPEYFDTDRQQFTRACPDATMYNELLARWSAMTAQEIRTAELDGHDVKDVAVKVSAMLTGRQPSIRKTDTVNELYRQWATGEIKGKKPNRPNLYHYKVFCEYAQRVPFSDINYKFISSFVSWMELKKGYKTNTIGSHLKDLKAVMSVGEKLGLHDNDAYRQFAKPSEEVDNVYLTDAELKKISALNLSGMLAKARDLFLVGCYTAMRFSDYSGIKLKDVEGKEYIRKRQQKTKGEVVIPIHPKVREIITKYKGAPKIDQVQLNRNIKAVCCLAGIDDAVCINGTYRKKYKLVSSHTARRTGATLMYLEKVPVYSIMMITGHKTESSFRKYIKVTLEENAHSLAGHPFFKG